MNQSEFESLMMAHDNLQRELSDIKRLIGKDKHELIKSNISLNKKVQELEDVNSQLGYLIGKVYGQSEFEIKDLIEQNQRYRKALEEIMKIQENHEWNLYGLAYGIAERILFDLEGEEIE